MHIGTPRAELPPGKLVSALIALETTRDCAELDRRLSMLGHLLAGQGRRRVEEGVQRVGETGSDVAAFRAVGGRTAGAEMRTMLAETVRE